MANKLNLNVAKTEFLLIGSKPVMKSISDSELNIKIYHTPIKKIEECKSLGVTIDQHWSWNSNTNNILAAEISALRRLQEFADKQTLLFVYYALIYPYFK